ASAGGAAHYGARRVLRGGPQPPPPPSRVGGGGRGGVAPPGASRALDLTLTGDRGPGMAPLLVRCHDEATQAREICARVLEAHEDGAALRDQAVLVRAAHHSDMLEIELSAPNVPYLNFRRPPLPAPP